MARKIEIDYRHIIELRRANKFKEFYDIQINKVSSLRKFHSFECHFVLYPYHRTIDSSHLKFSPFEEYVADLNNHHKSIYSRITDASNKFFGLFLGGLITLIFALFQPNGLLSVEAIVSIFAAYTVGKEIWVDIQKFFRKITKYSKLSFVENYYSFQLEKHSTLARYSNLAKKFRYPNMPILPNQMDFIQQSNSQTLRLNFLKRDIEHLTEDSAHLFTFQVDSKVQELLETQGFMLGVKFAVSKRSFFGKRTFEFFQSYNNFALGCLDERDNWQANTVFFRKTFMIGNLKYFGKNGLIADKQMLDVNLDF